MKTLKKENPIGVRLTKEALGIMQRVSQEQGITRTSVIEIALRKAFGKNESSTQN